MKITFFNDCIYVVNVSVKSGETIEINPHSTVAMECKKSDDIICIRPNNISFKKKGRYTLVLETQYRVTNIDDNDVFRITREKVCVSGNIYYDRLFLESEKAICSMETNNVLGAEEMKKKFNRVRIINMIFIGPLEYLTGCVILWILLGIVVYCKWGWKTAIIYFPVAYIFLLILNWVGDKICELVFNKVFKLKDGKTEFYNYFENEFITKYYSNQE